MITYKAYNGLLEIFIDGNHLTTVDYIDISRQAFYGLPEDVQAAIISEIARADKETV